MVNLTQFGAWIKAHKIAATLIAVAVVVGGIYVTSSKKPATPASSIFTVATTTLTQEVSVTGSVKAASVVDLSFEKSGRVAGVYQREGALVSPGQTIVALQNADLSASVEAAQADLSAQQAALAQTLHGARDEDIRVKQASVASAQQALDNYYSSIPDTLENAYTTADDATRAKLSAIYLSKDTSYQLAFTSCSGQESIDAISQRFSINTELTTWRTEINTFESASSTDALSVLDRATAHLATARTLLMTTSDILTASCTITNTALDTDRTNVNAARAELNTTATAVSALQQNILAQKAAVEKAQRDLELTQAPATADTVDAARAQVAAAQARLDAAEAELAKSEIRSPIAGVVTKVDAEVGELMTPGTPVVTVMSRDKFEIEANVAEADIAKLSIGNTADVTLDAYGDNVHFAAQIYFIDPAETIVSSVPTYRVKLQFLSPDTRIKSGMTANLKIVSAQKENVVAIPQRAISTTGTAQTVHLIGPTGVVIERTVTTGLRGSDGKIEIISGLSTGDKISLEPATGS